MNSPFIQGDRSKQERGNSCLITKVMSGNALFTEDLKIFWFGLEMTDVVLGLTILRGIGNFSFSR